MRYIGQYLEGSVAQDEKAGVKSWLRDLLASFDLSSCVRARARVRGVVALLARFRRRPAVGGPGRAPGSHPAASTQRRRPTTRRLLVRQLLFVLGMKNTLEVSLYFGLIAQTSRDETFWLTSRLC
jgi:hypothetical protein